MRRTAKFFQRLRMVLKAVSTIPLISTSSNSKICLVPSMREKVRMLSMSRVRRLASSEDLLVDFDGLIEIAKRILRVNPPIQ